jgi:hypothetical protein
MDQFRGDVTGMSSSPMKAIEEIYGDPLYYSIHISLLK